MWDREKVEEGGGGGGGIIPVATLSPPEQLLHKVGSDESHFNVS